MKRLFLLGAVCLCVLGVIAVAGARGHLSLKAGDSIHACDCGEECPCDSLSHNAGKCTCGADLVEAKVVESGEGEVKLEADGWEGARSFATTGKYTCACPPDCPCDSISQNAGKCACGAEMKAVEE